MFQREQLADIDESGIRRSSRTCRSTYLTYNQKVLEQGYDYEERPKRPRRSLEVARISDYQNPKDVCQFKFSV